MSQIDRTYQFTGVSPYIDEAAKVLGLEDAYLTGKARNIEHLARIQTALGQASQASADDREAIFAQALAFEKSLAVALRAAQQVIYDAAVALGFDDSDYVENNLHFSATFSNL